LHFSLLLFQKALSSPHIFLSCRIITLFPANVKTI
jgi:hypothetical protein